MFSSIPSILTPNEMEKLLAERFKVLRLQAGLKRTTLAQRAGVTVASLKRFETSGRIFLKNLLRLAHTVGGGSGRLGGVCLRSDGGCCRP